MYLPNQKPIKNSVRSVVWLAALLLSLPAIATAQSGTYSNIIKYSVPTPGSYPEGITVGPDGALWFTEAIGDKIGRISPRGPITEYVVPTPYSQPSGITAGPDHALWFTEWIGNKIGRITIAGSVTEFLVPTADSRPNGITAGPDGAVWFTEQQAIDSKIGRITTSGAITEYPVPTPYSSPYWITGGPDGALWFTENAGNKIGRITTAGVITRPQPPSTRGRGLSIPCPRPTAALTGSCRGRTTPCGSRKIRATRLDELQQPA